jgi:hypothetical protein
MCTNPPSTLELIMSMPGRKIVRPTYALDSQNHPSSGKRRLSMVTPDNTGQAELRGSAKRRERGACAD